MKKLFLALTLAIFLTVGLSAQVDMGIKAGLNLSTINGPDVESFDGRTAFHFGAYFGFTVGDNFTLQPELLYSIQGSDYSDPDESGTVKLDYLNIPIMARFNLSDAFIVEAGPQIGILLSAKDEWTYDGMTDEYDIDDHVKGIDFGLNIGLGYVLESGLNFGARYNFGLTDVNDSDDLDDGAEYKNGNFMISVGYSFN